MAQIKLAEYTFDNSVGDCLPTLRLSSIEMTTEDIVSGAVTRRTVYIDNATLPYQLYFQNQTALLTVDYLHIGSNITNLASLFSGCTKLKTVNTTNWDLSSCTNISFMFQNCSSLTKLDIRNWVTGSITTMQGMFHSCTSLTEIKGIENFNVSSVTSFGAMFYNCKSLLKLDLRNWVTSAPKISTMQDMFSGCESLELLRVDNFDTSKLQHTLSLNGMFQNCKKLKTLNLNSFVNPGTLGNAGSFFYGCSSLEYISMNNFVFGNCISMGYVFKGCTNLKILDLTQLDTTTMTHANLGLMMPDIVSGVTCPIYYNSNTCNHTAITGLSNAIDVKGRLMAVYDFNNTVTTSDSAYPVLTGSTITKTIDTQGSESNITHRVIGVDVMPTAISFNSIRGLLNVDYLAVTNSCTSLVSLFENCFRMTYVDTFGWDTSNVTRFGYCFRTCSSLTEIRNIQDLKVTSKVTEAYDFFNGCPKLTSLDLTHWDVSGIKNGSVMFKDCSGLTSLNISNWDVSSMQFGNSMFQGCTSLSELDLTSFKTTAMESDNYNMFSSWTSDQIVYIHDTNWTINVSSYNATFVRRLSKLLAQYTFDNSIGDCLPTITGITTSDYKVSDIVNDTITTRLLSTDSDKTITQYVFSGNAIPNNKSLLTLDYLKIDNNITSLHNLLQNCDKLVSVNAENWDTSSVTSMGFFLQGCGSLIEVKGLGSFNTSKVTNLAGALQVHKLTNIQEISNWDISNCTSFAYLFSASTLTGELDLSNWNPIKAENMQNMFALTKLTSINLSGWDVPKLNSMTSMFAGHSTNSLISVNMSNWTMGTPANMNSMFYNNPNLTSIDFTGSKMISSNLQQTFQSCSKLTSLDVSGFDTSQCTNMGLTFSLSSKLTTLTGIENWVTDNVTAMNDMFNGLTQITELNLANWDTRKVVSNNTNMFRSWTSDQTVCYEPPFWSIGTTTLNSNINWVIQVTRNNGYWLDMTGITGATKITLYNENNLPTEEILTDWGDGTQDSELTHTYSTAGEYVVVSNLQLGRHENTTIRPYLTNATIYYKTSLQYLFESCTKLKTVTFADNFIDILNQQGTQNFFRLFNGCSSLIDTNEEQWKKLKPNDITQTFNGCASLTTLDLENFDTSKVKSFNLAFRGCSKLTEIKGIEKFNVSSATNFGSMFYDCSSLTSLDLSSWDTSQCTNMGYMFQNCSSLTLLNLSNFNTSKVTTMNNMFASCSSLTSLDLSSFNTISVNNMNQMFMSCQKLKTLDLSHFDTSNVVKMGGVFQNCSSLTSLDLSSFNTSSVNDIGYMFQNCSSLTSLDLSNFNVTNASLSFAFQNCNLKQIGLVYSNAPSINKIAENLYASSNCNVYYYDADPSQLTPVEGVTFKKYQVPTTIQLPPHIQLHSLPDGTRDEVDIKTGILTHNIGECTWNDSTVGWGVSIGDGSTTFYHLGDWGVPNYGTIQQDMNLPLEVNGNNTIVISPNVIGIEVWGNAEARKMNIHVPMKFNNENKAKQWLKENQVTFIYRKETPTTEQLILNYNNSCDYGRILPTGMCDKYDVVNSMYTQTMTSILLDGENTWDAMEEMTNVIKFTATGTTVGVENLNMLGAGGLYCDNDLFPNINDDSDVPHCRVDEAGNKFYIYVDKEMLMSPDLIGWQIWLQANNFNMVYELAEHLTYTKPYEELDPTQARWEGMDCMRDGAIKYHANNSDNLTMYPTLEYVAPSINNFEVTMLESNTDYTIYADGINKNDTINLGGTDINFNNGTVVTSGDNQWLRIDNNDSFYNMVITKGDTTGEVVPYFEGMASVENPSTISKNNGLNCEVIRIGGCTQTGDFTFTVDNARDAFAKTDFILENGKTYKISCEVEYEGTLPAYTSDKTSHKVILIWANNNFGWGARFIPTKETLYNCEVTIPNDNNIYYLGFGITSNANGNTGTVTIKTITIDNGTKILQGLYKESTVSYTDLKLRSLPNGVKDTINVVTGEYIQRVGEVVLNGSEDWVLSAHENSTSFYTPLNDLVRKEDYLNSISCDKFVTHTYEWTLHNSISLNGISAYVDWLNDYPNENWLYIKHADSESSVEKFKQWLKENPVTVQYELAEPITTQLDAQTLLAYTNGTINLSSDTGLLPTTHYTVPSTNTFHLPSMKTGTRYTLKYPSASGSITIGDITYKISSDSMLFTTPLKINGDTSAIIFTDANPENVVLLEGAYNKREVPFFTGIKSVKNPNITIIDQLSTESTTYNCETEIELRGLPNGVADKLDIVKGKLTTNVGIRPYQEGDENLPNIWTDGYETVYALSSPVVTNVAIDNPTVTTNSLIELSSDYLIPQLNYRAPSSNNFPLDLLQPNTTYTLYADTLASGSYTLGGTRTGVYSQPHTITLGDMTDNLLTFNGDLGLSNVMLVKGNSLKTTLPPYFLGIRSVTDGHLLVEGMAGEMNELTIDEGIVLRDCNGVKDTIDLITCTLTKRTGEITLTGAEGWFAIPNESVNAPDDYVVFALTLQGVDSSNKYDLICDTITSKYLYNKPHDTESIYGLNNSIRMCVKKSRIGGDNVNALKAWLNQNPTTVVYSLRTPLEVQLENTWTTLPPTSYNNQTEISSTVSTNSLKPMISVTVATTTLEEIVSNLEAQNAQLEEENIATMLALTSVYETLAVPSVATTEPQVATYGLRRSAEPTGMSVSPMGMVYARLVSKGFKSIDEVPYNLQAEVMYALRGME